MSRPELVTPAANRMDSNLLRGGTDPRRSAREAKEPALLLMLLILSLTSIVAVYILFPEPRGQQSRAWPAAQPIPIRDVDVRPRESHRQV